MFEFLKKTLRNALGIERKRQPIWIFQMGKVGSQTVDHSLSSSHPNLRFEHVHLLNRLDEIESAVRATRQNPERTLRQIQKGRELRAVVDGYWGRHRVITLVRDPVARNVSAFFQAIEEISPGVLDQDAGALDYDDLRSRFLNDPATHNAPLRWFETQLKPVFGVDVFDHPFPWEKGYQILRTRKTHLLVIRLEDLNRVFEEAVDRFAGLSGTRIAVKNRGEEKDYKEMYFRFRQHAVIPPDYLETQYSSKYARHFYSPEEIEQFRRKWSQPA